MTSHGPMRSNFSDKKNIFTKLSLQSAKYPIFVTVYRASAYFAVGGTYVFAPQAADPLPPSAACSEDR